MVFTIVIIVETVEFYFFFFTKATNQSDLLLKSVGSDVFFVSKSGST